MYKKYLYHVLQPCRCYSVIGIGITHAPRTTRARSIVNFQRKRGCKAAVKKGAYYSTRTSSTTTTSYEYSSSSPSSSSSSCREEEEDYYYKYNPTTDYNQVQATVKATTVKADVEKENNKNGNENRNKKKILICGDGDLSFGAKLATAYSSSGTRIHTRTRTGTGTSNTNASTNNASANENIQLIVTVLESESDHNRVYQHSKQNVETIRRHGGEVMFEVDATQLSNYFGTKNFHDRPHVPGLLELPNENEYENNSAEDEKVKAQPRASDECKCNGHGSLFDRIQFNFPHWRGKQNNRRNRKLIQDFFKSATNFLPPGSQIHMALLNHQGGMRATNQIEWKKSWMPAKYTAEANLLLTHILPFEPEYSLSSYQWRDKPFSIGGKSKSEMYIFTKPDGISSAPKDIQLCSYFSLFVALPSASPPPPESSLAEDNCTANQSRSLYWSSEQILDADFIQGIVHSHLLEGIRAEVKCWRIHFRHNFDEEASVEENGKWMRNEQLRPMIPLVAEYRIGVFGERSPITASQVENCKELVEAEVEKMTKGTRKSGWPVSNAIPSSLLKL